MQITEVVPQRGGRIDAYGPGGFRIDGAWHEGSLIVSPSGVERFEGPVGGEALKRVLAIADELDVVLIGQGADFAPLARETRIALEEAGIGAEPMSTDAACRTYNLLLAEERRVAAVLIAL